MMKGGAALNAALEAAQIEADDVKRNRQLGWEQEEEKGQGGEAFVPRQRKSHPPVVPPRTYKSHPRYVKHQSSSVEELTSHQAPAVPNRSVYKREMEKRQSDHKDSLAVVKEEKLTSKGSVEEMKNEEQPPTSTCTSNAAQMLHEQQTSAPLIEGITIPGTGAKVDLQEKNQKPFAVYYVQVWCENGLCWIVERRFSEFVALGKRIKLPKSQLYARPKLPSRFTHKTKFSSGLLEHRRRCLEEYLSETLKLCLILRNNSSSYKVLKDFLDADFVVQTLTQGQAAPEKSRAKSFQLPKPRPKHLSRKTMNDKTLLRARELMKQVVKMQPSFLKAPVLKNENGVVLPPKAISLTGSQDISTSIVEQLGKMVALQQTKVDWFVRKVCKQYCDDLGLCGDTRAASALEKSSSLSELDHEDTIKISSLEATNDEKSAVAPPPPSTEGKTPSVSRARSYMSMLLNSSPMHHKAQSSDFVDKSALSDQVLARIHRFLANMSWKVLKAHSSVVEPNYAVGYNEDFHFNVLYRLFEVSTLQRHPQIQKLLRRCASLSENNEALDEQFRANVRHLHEHFSQGIPPSFFGACVHPQFRIDVQQAHKQYSAWGWEEAAMELACIQEKADATPSMMAECVLRCVHVIQEGLKQVSESRRNTDDDSVRALGADDFVPIFFYVIASSKLRNPFTTHKLVTSIASDVVLDAEAKYWLTVFESGLHFITKLDLSGDLDNKASLEGP